MQNLLKLHLALAAVTFGLSGPSQSQSFPSKPIHLVTALPAGNDAYVRVRLTERAGPTGSATVYLLDGTALMVPGRDLIRLAPAGSQLPEATALVQNAGR